MKSSELPPIVRSITVGWPQAEAFRRFTADFSQWWPVHTHSIGGKCVARVVFECKQGGLIFEQHHDGRRFQWGEVLDWDPPRRVRFTWHPARDKSTAQEVTLTFAPAGPESIGTRLELVAIGGENWGKGATHARRGYSLGWAGILNTWAGKKTATMRALAPLMLLAELVQKLRGGTPAAIARAGGELDAPTR